MRCKCCNHIDTLWWKDDYYCQDCRDSIRKQIKQAFDNNPKETAIGGDLWIVHSDWDEEDG